MLTLVVPGLIWPRQALADLSHDLPLPALRALLGRGRRKPLPPGDGPGLLAAELGLPSPLPAAALRRLASGAAADTADWLCLDPVQLAVTERHLVLGDPAQLQLAEAEAREFAVSLAPTLKSLGELEVLAPGAWNLRLAQPAPAFPDLATAIGRAVTPFPVQADYAPWRAALNEAQMVLHTHHVNAARAARGLPAVNSLWPWGGGRLPAAFAPRVDRLHGDAPLLAGLARLLGIPLQPLADGLDPASSRPLAFVDALLVPARLGEAMAWRDALERLYALWLAPAGRHLREGRLSGLRLLAPGESGGVELVLDRGDAWRFWRRPCAPADAFAIEALRKH